MPSGKREDRYPLAAGRGYPLHLSQRHVNRHRQTNVGRSCENTYVEVPLETPVNAIAPYVEQAIRRLFVLFGVYVMPSAAIEHWVQRLTERVLN